MTHSVEFPNLGLQFEVNPTAFTVFGLEIKWYAVIIAFGFLLAFIYVMRRAKEFGLDSDKVFDAVFWGTLGGIVGARLYFVAFKLDYYLANPGEIFMTREGGMAIYGGIIGALLIGLLVCRRKKIKILPMLDMAAVGFLIGQGIGRWGNFVNQEAYGSVTDPGFLFGMTSEKIVYEVANQPGAGFNPDVLVHPCFLYESVWCLLGAVVLLFYIKHRRFDGEISLLYLGWYGFERAIVEGLRTDSLYIPNTNIRVSQLLSAILCVAAVAMLVFFYFRIAKRRKTEPAYMQLYVKTPEAIERMDALEAQRAEERAKREEKKQRRKEGGSQPAGRSEEASAGIEQPEQAPEQIKQGEKEEGAHTDGTDH